jgi:hypothetical protein
MLKIVFRFVTLPPTYKTLSYGKYIIRYLPDVHQSL